MQEVKSLVSDFEVETSKDGFLDNSIFVIQPAKGAHRSGTDAILLAAAVADEVEGNIADFGAGCGVAGMAVAHRCAKSRVDLIEVDPVSVSMAQKSVALEQNQHLSPRVSVVQADLSASNADRERSGLVKEHYAHIIANPPYNNDALQVSPDVKRARAHVMEQDLLLAWIKTAAFVAKPKAKLTMILRPQTLGELISALGNRFGSAKILPLHSKKKLAASRIIVQATKGGKAPLEILPALVIHQDEGCFTDKAEEIFRGRCGLPM